MSRASMIYLALLLVAASGAHAQEGRYADVRGMRLYYEVSGQGEPLVVLHGSFMSIPSMGPIIPALAKHHRVYALEFRGHGRSTDIAGPITYTNLADDVAAFMDAIGLPKANVFGYSLGAGAGLQLAIRHPAKVNRLVAASVAYDASGLHPDYKAFLPQLNVEAFLQTPFAAEYRRLSPTPDSFPRLARKLIALERAPFAWGKDVKKLRTPVLLIVGDADAYTLEHSVSLFRLLGGGVMGDLGKPLAASRLAILPATAHTAVITQVGVLQTFVDQFLKGETPKGFGQ